MPNAESQNERGKSAESPIASAGGGGEEQLKPARRSSDAQEMNADPASHDPRRTVRELRRLVTHLFRERQQQREQVARELHDEVSQRLSLLEIALHEMRCDHWAADDVDRLEAARDHVHVLNSEVRQICKRLHPSILADLGLSLALKALANDFGEREQMPVTYVTQNLPEEWCREAADAIYFIAQEALQNVAEHAGRTHVKVILAGEGGQMRLQVLDFGVGFDIEADQAEWVGLGMISMRERAEMAGGRLLVRSTLGQGTTIIAEVPRVTHA